MPLKFSLVDAVSDRLLVPDVDEQYIEQEAHILGCAYPFSEGVRRLFEGTSLEAAYVFGDNEAEAPGHKIMELRAHDFENRKELILETSRRVNMRSTGHSWCLAQDEGCGGSGIYAKGRCGGCHDGLVDRRFVPICRKPTDTTRSC